MRWLLALPIRKHHSASVCAAVLLTAATGAAQSPQAGGALPAPSTPAAPAVQIVAPTPLKSVLNQSVTIVGANDNNDALSMAVPLGTPLSLILVVKEPPAGHPRGELRTFPFASQGEQPPAIATAKLRTGESNATVIAAAGESAPVALDKPGQIAFSFEFERLRPGKTYKGQLFLASADLLHHWDITLTTGGRGTVAVDPVGTLKFVTFPPFTSVGPFAGTGSFSFTLYDKSEGGPYHRVRVRFEPSAPANSKALTSTFSLDTLSFWEKDKPVDLEQRDAGGHGANGGDVTLTSARTFTTRVAPLSPGEYSGALHFAADGAADDAAEAKLPLMIQVRHHWLLPIVVILFGSVVGWFSSKYVVGARKARDLSRQVKELRARADFLVRPSDPPAGWEFPNEAGSLGFARVLVTLNRLAKLTASTMEVLIHGDEIEQLRQRAELRLSALESLRIVRLHVQPAAHGRPAAQRAIGRLLRSATDLLERPTFGEAEQADLTKLVDVIQAWANAATFGAAYQQALLDRRRSNECPELPDVQGLAAGPVRAQLERLCKLMPSEQAITELTAPLDLKDSDENMARIALLWRVRAQAWAGELAAAYAADGTLHDLFHAVDTNLWNTLKTAAKDGHLVLELDSAGQDKPQTYEVVEMDLASRMPGLEVKDVRYHPLRVGWRIRSPGGDVRTTDTDGLTLVQYFPSKGSVKVEASLRWAGEEIPIETPLSFHVEQNPEYVKRGMFTTEWTEYAAITVAALFAIVTAMGTQYDSTFGTFTQYVTLFVWAAGAGTGGNLFSQLGTTSAPGGAVATLK
jgi:hypothetical protein